MSSSESPPTDVRPETHESPRFHLSAVQLIASVLAAVTAAVAASYLGVNGTVIGAAVASLLSVLGTAVYSHSLQRTSARVRTAVPASARWMPPVNPGPGPTSSTRNRPAGSGRRGKVLQRIALASAAVFIAALGLLTGVELLAGRPVTDLLNHRSASGTTVFGSQGRTDPATPVPAVTVTVVPHVVVTTPTVTETAPAITTTTTPSGTTTTSPAPSTAGPTSTSTPAASPTPTPAPLG